MVEENKKKPNPIDTHVGGRIRLRRNMLGMSQEKLGENLGITFQQIQKYEKGTNRVGASRLQAIASILGVPVAFFLRMRQGRKLSAAGFPKSRPRLSPWNSAPRPKDCSSTAPSFASPTRRCGGASSSS